MNEYLGHIMLDLETMGDVSNSVITSIGAVEFNIETGETGKEFYRNIDIQSSLDNGLVVTASTIEWWFNQNQEAQKLLFKDSIDLNVALNEFREYFTELSFIRPIHMKPIQIWGNGARFDIRLLEDSFRAIYVNIPWNPKFERDVRTLVSIKPEIRDVFDKNFKGIKHNPIDDAKHQIKYCSAIWKSIHNLE
jgi:hypothetical protein